MNDAEVIAELQAGNRLLKQERYKLLEKIEQQSEQIKGLEEKNAQLEKWQIKPTEAICLTDISCRYKKVFKND